jgi:hypothetical protein
MADKPLSDILNPPRKCVGKLKEMYMNIYEVDIMNHKVNFKWKGVNHVSRR